jgi:hypothetical protein
MTMMIKLVAAWLLRRRPGARERAAVLPVWPGRGSRL